MPISSQKGLKDRFKPTRLILAVMAFWTFGILLSLAWNITQTRDQSLMLATMQAQSSLEKDVIYRRWYLEHGGIYVPVTEKTQPNPNLAGVPERDITTPSGKRLTLMNHAYMLRQVHELAQKENGLVAHITSLEPSNSQNCADQWETAALKAAQSDKSVIASLQQIEGKEYMRLIRPLSAERQCLKCHDYQEYETENVLGGISISIPMEPFRSSERKSILTLLWAHGLLWMLGISWFVYAGRRMQQDETERKSAEYALRASEEKHRSLVENTTDIIMRFDREYRCLFVNSAVKAALDSNPDELIGKTHGELGFPEECGRFWEERMQLVLDGKKTLDAELKFVGKNGPVDFDCRLFPEFDDNGEVVTILGVARDVTRERRSEKNYRMLFDAMLDGFALHEILCDANGKPVDYRFLDVNSAFEQLTGISADRIKGKTVLEILPNTEPSWIERYGRVALTGEPTRFEAYSKEMEKWFEVVGFCPEAYRFACIFQDITKRKNAEAQLRSSEERLKLLFEYAPDAYFLTDLKGNYIDVNRAAEDVSGYGRAELIGRNLMEMGLLGPEGVMKAASILERNALGEPSGPDEFAVTRKNGDNIDVEIRTYPTRIDGQMLVLGITRDITERKRLESQLRQAQKTEVIGALAGGIAHDFNNILSAIIGFTQLALLDLPQGSPLKYNHDQVLQASYRARDLVKQILMFSRQTNLQERQPVEIKPILKEAVKFLRATLPSTIEITQNIDAEPCVTLADPTQIHQVLINLSTNAAHAMEDGGGILEIALEHVVLDSLTASVYMDTKPGSYLKLSVRDTGHGMDKATIERIFEPYFTTKEMGKGSGLGLAVVHGIVKRHQGVITVDSQPGKGSTFRVFLPSIDAKPSDEKNESEQLPGGRGRVLFVDDEEPLVDIGSRIIKTLGYEVLGLQSGVEALEVFRSNPNAFDLLITDLTMPKITGDELAKQVMAIRPDIPIILTTGFSEKISEENAKTSGIEELIIKPITVRNLAEAISKALNKNDGKQALPPHAAHT